MGDLSPHFAVAEFKDRRTGCAPIPPPALVEALERLRETDGHAIVITSGHRCPTSNAAVGGAKRSRHLSGDAVDIRIGTHTVDQAVAAGFTGIGSWGSWAVHVDVRPGPLVRWSYGQALNPEDGC